LFQQAAGEVVVDHVAVRPVVTHGETLTPVVRRAKGVLPWAAPPSADPPPADPPPAEPGLWGRKL
jgi:hypothetical protein